MKMIFDKAGERFCKAGFVLISVMLLGAGPVYCSDSPVKSAKQSSAQPGAKRESVEWQKIVNAARKEGKLVMTADPSDYYRKVLVVPFEKKYPDITVEYTGMNGRDFRPRLMQERKVGKYLWDVRISGINPETYEMKDEGYFDPLRSLILPEIADDSKWHGGFGYTFTDKEQRCFATAFYFAEYRVLVNRDFLSEAQFNSSKQLIDPQFKGKIVILNPKSGSGLAAVAQLYVLYGEQFVRELFQKQDIVNTSDKRQQVEWLTRGRYPIALGMEQGFLLDFQKKGVGQNVKPLKNSQDDSLKAVHLVNKAPHPNAARVYVNWLLSEEGQKEMVKGLEGISMRKDIEPVDKESTSDPLSAAHRRLYEENTGIREKVQDLVREVVK
jgi:ABC-type Fe3+ transport system substrate-binding protein